MTLRLRMLAVIGLLGLGLGGLLAADA